MKIRKKFLAAFDSNPLLIWLSVAAILRILAVFTRSGWGHPDEWFQTVEFSNYIVNGFATNVQEVGLHMRNFLWPSFLAIPLIFAGWIDDSSVVVRVILIQLFVVALSLAMIWGWWQGVKYYCIKFNFKKKYIQHIGLALCVLPYFSVSDSIRPSAEHLSVILIFVALGFFYLNSYFLFGLLSVAIGAVKYSVGFVSLGFAAAVLLLCFKNKKNLFRYFLGIFLGLILFGIPDWIIYGHPWESLWMYLQFNVFTGLSHQTYGTQSVFVYIDWFQGHWFGFLFPFSIVVFFFSLLGFGWGIKNKAPWAFAGVFYLIPHLFIAHKEPRFMAPFEWIWVWAALIGFYLFWKRFDSQVLKFFKVNKIRLKILYFFAAIFLLINSILIFRDLFRENWTMTETYFEVDKLLKNNKDICGVITRRQLTSVHYPITAESIFNLKKPAFAYFAGTQKENSFAQAQIRENESTETRWLEQAPECNENEFVFLNVHKPDEKWVQNGCQVLETGVLNFVPQKNWDWALKNIVSGPWYQCPSQILNFFKNQVVLDLLVTQIVPYDRWPPYGISGRMLMEYEQKGRQTLKQSVIVK